MKLLIDADACPVVEICLKQARKRGIPMTLYCDTSHILRHEEAENRCGVQGGGQRGFCAGERPAPGDLAVTQDYGLAAMCLSRKARASCGRTGWNIPTTTSAPCCWRGTRRARSAGAEASLHRAEKRDAQQDAAFEAALIRVLDELTSRLNASITSTRISTSSSLSLAMAWVPWAG